MPPRRAAGGPTIHIAVLASGSGTNLQALIETPAVRPKISVVISDKPDAGALDRAAIAGIKTAVVSWGDYEDREAFSAGVADTVASHGAEGVVLAGFMRVLSPVFIDRFPNRVINIHPSLLPAFPGSSAIESAIRHSVKITGVTVHFVDEKVDNGPIIAQVPVEVLPDDTVESLHRRIQAEEHRLYPEVVAAFVSGQLEVVGRTVVSKVGATR